MRHSNCGHGPIRISHVRKCRFCRCAKRDECKVWVCEYSYECLFVFAFPCTLFSTLFPSLHPCAMRQTAGNFPLNVLDTRDFQWGNRRRARGCCRGYFLLAGYGSCSCSRLNRWRCICVPGLLPVRSNALIGERALCVVYLQLPRSAAGSRRPAGRVTGQTGHICTYNIDT